MKTILAVLALAATVAACSSPYTYHYPYPPCDTCSNAVENDHTDTGRR